MAWSRRLRSGTLARVLLAGFMLLIPGCGGPPALESKEAFSTADALYTAITSRRTELLDKSETRLSELQNAGKLSNAAFESLKEIIEHARAGDWQVAAEELDSFIRYQPSGGHLH
ncbi:MAG: hypothetical protein KDB01_10020 [Planctomycetaceae bacterium]|nr:hypothetical protein [Planctomycetaceae bacterium]